MMITKRGVVIGGVFLCFVVGLVAARSQDGATSALVSNGGVFVTPVPGTPFSAIAEQEMTQVLKDDPKHGKRPLVFMFQPTHYKVVSSPAQLKLWEKTMLKDVGVSPDSLPRKKVKDSLTLSYNIWRSNSDLTDCDEA